MAYITARNNHFYVVTYDGIDPITNKERRRWVPAGKSRTDAEAIATTINNTTPPVPRASAGDLTLGQYLRTTWLPKRQRRVRETTAYRYSWMIDRYIMPSLGRLPLRSVRTDHIDDLYFELATTGGRNQTGLAPKRPETNASTQPYTSRPQPACVEAKSLASGGVTGTNKPIHCPFPDPVK